MIIVSLFHFQVKLNIHKYLNNPSTDNYSFTSNDKKKKTKGIASAKEKETSQIEKERMK